MRLARQTQSLLRTRAARLSRPCMYNKRAMCTVALHVPPQRLSQAAVPLSTSEKDFKDIVVRNHGHLNDARNQPKASWSLQAITNVKVLECLAELCSTEFQYKTLSVELLKKVYREQLAAFEGSRKAELEKEGVSGVIVDHLHDIYRFRANVSTYELQRALRVIGFLGDHRKYRVFHSMVNDVRRVPSQVHRWTIFPTIEQTLYPAYNKEQLGATNKENADSNARRLRGARGLIIALNKGLTAQQWEHLHETADKYGMDDRKKHEILTKFAAAHERLFGKPAEHGKSLHDVLQLREQKDKPIGKIEVHPDTSKVLLELKESLSIDQWAYLERVLADEEEPEMLWIATEEEASKFSKDLSDVFNKARSKFPQNKDKLDKLENAIKVMTTKESQKKLRTLSLLEGSNMLASEMEKVLEPFASLSQDVSEDLLNDVANPHAVPLLLWANRMQWLADDHVSYTQEYEEFAANGTFKDINDPKHAGARKFVQDGIEEGRFEDSGIHFYPNNSGFEDVVTAQIELMAERYLGFDLSTDDGVAAFDAFAHSHKISPGEVWLDRVHPYPPPLHTYDELPIIKYDGWDDADVPEEHPQYFEELELKKVEMETERKLKELESEAAKKQKQQSQ